MSTPDFGDKITRIGDYLRYPRRVLIDALEQAFASEFFYTNEGKVPNPFLYKKLEDGSDTAPDSLIEIADGWTDELNKTDMRPIILCQRDTMTFADSSIDGREGYDIWGTTMKFSDFLTVPLNFLCYSRIDVEADEIGLVVGLFLRLFRQHLRTNSKFFQIKSPAIGPLTPVDTDVQVDVFSVPVSVLTYMPITWKMSWGDLKEAKDVEIDTTLVTEPGAVPQKDFFE